MRYVLQDQSLYHFHMIYQSICSFEHLFFIFSSHFFTYQLDFSLNIYLEIEDLDINVKIPIYIVSFPFFCVYSFLSMFFMVLTKGYPFDPSPISSHQSCLNHPDSNSKLKPSICINKAKPVVHLVCEFLAVSCPVRVQC